MGILRSRGRGEWGDSKVLNRSWPSRNSCVDVQSQLPTTLLIFLMQCFKMFIYLILSPHYPAYGTLVPQPGIKLGPPAG